jgi:hypothetical protein
MLASDSAHIGVAKENVRQAFAAFNHFNGDQISNEVLLFCIDSDANASLGPHFHAQDRVLALSA